METPSHPRPNLRPHSLFGPIILIGIGVIWLLVNFNLVPAFSLGRLLRLWPLFLIAAGLELLFGRGRAWVGALIGLLTVAAAVALLVYGPQLGFASATTLKTEAFDAPLAGTTAAQVTLDLDRYATDVGVTDEAAHLVEADLAYTGEAVFEVSGTAQKSVTIGVRSNNSDPFDFLEDLDAHWQIGLSPDVPLDLAIDGASGSANFELQTLDLDSLTLDSASGAVTLSLPAGTGYEADVNGGSGAIHIRFATDTQATLRYDGGSGALRVDVPGGQAVRVEVRDSGSGSVRVPGGWETVSDGDNDEGVWQTPGYDAASAQLLIVINGLGSGSITVN
jgi:hypothetical protein